AWSPLAVDRVRYVGDAVVIVVAETKGQARDAAEAVTVTYAEKPSVTDAAAALEAGAPQLHPEADGNLIYDWAIGDAAATDAAIKSAKHVTRLHIVNNRLVPNAMEPRAALGHYDKAEDHYTCWTTSQNPHVARLVMSAFYNIAPENKLRVIAPDVGGGFGSKIFIYPEELVCLWASRKTGVPVKWVADRTESFLTDAHGRDHVTEVEMAFDADNRITGLRVDTIANFGAYMSLFSSSVPTYLYATLLSGQYAIPAAYVNVRTVYTNTAPVDAYRGAGRPEATFVVERLVEIGARAMGIDPAELRRRNFIKSFPHQTPVIMTYDAGDYHASLKKALEAADYKNFAKRKRESARDGKLRGIGLSAYIEACGIAPSQAVGSLGCGVGLWESAEVRVNPTGSVEILTGTHSHGQGHETTFAQLVSERLGIPIDTISIVHGDTDKVQFGMGTYGSRSGAVGMSAVVKALDKVEAKAKKVAAHLLEAAEGDIEFKDGKFTVSGTDKSAAWGEVALNAYIAHRFAGQELEPGLKEGAFYDPTNFTFPAGCHVCEVEVDPSTGKTDIVGWTAVDDFGVVVNPMIVEGQVHGGIAQGVGQALLEHTVYNSDGQLVSGSFMDYTMPKADDFPPFQVDMTVTKCPSNPLGIKGCGEAGAIAAPAAVINAITHAIGSEDLAMPATPQAVWAALQKVNAKAAA
ncbi:MAG: xanthine dehydrogenase family protein molybdopterin-binding subunit, partial [Xanthobacteraceae bacterium]